MTIIGEPLLTEQRGGVSDANIVSAAGVATIDGFGPFGDGDHTELERANKASFIRRIKQVSKILIEFNGVQTQAHNGSNLIRKKIDRHLVKSG